MIPFPTLGKTGLPRYNCRTAFAAPLLSSLAVEGNGSVRALLWIAVSHVSCNSFLVIFHAAPGRPSFIVHD